MWNIPLGQPHTCPHSQHGTQHLWWHREGRGHQPSPTRFVLVLDVEPGDDAVAVKPLRPSQIHTSGFHLADLQLWRVRGLLGTERQVGDKRERSPPGAGDPHGEALHPGGTNTLDGELDQASVLAIGVDGVAGEEDRVPAVGWLQLQRPRERTGATSDWAAPSTVSPPVPGVAETGHPQTPGSDMP